METVIIALGMFVAWALCVVVRNERSEPPPPEGKVTSSAQIRPHDVRPSGAPMGPGEGWK